MPADLPGLLSGRQGLVGKLVVAGIETSRALLRLSADERRLTPRVGPAVWRDIADVLAERWPGVALGCLCVEEQPRDRGPPRPRHESKADILDRVLGLPPEVH